MPRLLGASRANWLILTGESIGASTALEWGLVNKVAPLARLDAEVDKVADGLLACGTQALRAQKALLRSWEELPLPQALRHSISTFGAAFTTGEPQEFMQAFLDRRRK
jgi:enoyl-CoA hydratase